MPRLVSSRPHSVSFFPEAQAPEPFSWKALLGFVALSFAAGAVGQIVSGPNVSEYYAALQRPPLAPPSWVFGPVWSALYLAMGFSAARVWRYRKQPQARRALTWFMIQLGLNSAWSGLFFGLRNPGLALAEIVLVWAAVAAYTLSAARLDRPAAWLVAPYWAWVTFATYLNAGVWWLNR